MATEKSPYDVEMGQLRGRALRPADRPWFQHLMSAQTGYLQALQDMAPLRESHHNLLEILSDLADLQNGPSLLKYEADWRVVMAAARLAIAQAEALEKGETS